MKNTPIPPVMPVYGRSSLEFDRGEGPYIFDTGGRRYLDFGSGIAVTGLGHCHPHLVEALETQGRKLWHTSNLYHIGQMERLCERLVAHCFADTVFVGNSGAEAMEACIKVARRYHHARENPERNRIVTFEGAFHGRTMATISAAGGAKLCDGFAPLLEGFDRVPFDDLAAVEAAISDQTAAIMIEPIQGEGGIRPASRAFLEGLRELADENGLLLIFDEVQCGMGRTGRLFAHQELGVEPDIMGLAKGLGGGIPIGACLATARAASGMTRTSHGSTFGGNPLCAAVANAVLDVMLDEGFLDQVRSTAETLRNRLEQLAAAHPNVITEIRGLGLMLGMKVVPTNTDVVAELNQRGLLTIGAADNVIRLLPPLIIGEAEIDEACGIIDDACTALAA